MKAHRVYEEFTACRNRAILTFSLETGKEEKADLKVSLEHSVFGVASESHQTKISDLVGSITTTKADLEAATAILANEQVDFGKSEQEFFDVFDTLMKAMRRR